MAAARRRRRRDNAPAISFVAAEAAAQVQKVQEQYTAAVERAAQYGGEQLVPTCGRSNRTSRDKTASQAEDPVHHHPPKDQAREVGFPVRGGQTLLIAYFPWESKEVDIEREFSKVARVKRVHLVMDKSSNKPRCFGFVKFMSRADAEAALRATMQGFVQLTDQRGHIWHIKAEWSKSGDMVVDDNAAELEVIKRKEERKKHDGPRPRGRSDASTERSTWCSSSSGKTHTGQTPAQSHQARFSAGAVAMMHPGPQMHGPGGQAGAAVAQAPHVYAGMSHVRPMQPMFNAVTQAAMFGNGHTYASAYPGGPNHVEFGNSASSSQPFLQGSFNQFSGQFPSSPFATNQHPFGGPSTFTPSAFGSQAAQLGPGFAPAPHGHAFAFHGPNFGGYGPSPNMVQHGLQPALVQNHNSFPPGHYPNQPTTQLPAGPVAIEYSNMGSILRPSQATEQDMAKGELQSDPSSAPEASMTRDPPSGDEHCESSDYSHFDVVWQLPKMSLANTGGLPAAGQPPSPATHTSFVPVQANGAWGSFDDAAAKGMVDGLVGEDAVGPPWTSTQAV